MCGLRSNEWLKTFRIAFMMLNEAQISRFSLSDAEIDTADAVGKKLFADTIASISCRALVNSPEMDRLDAKQRRIIGGYH